MNTRWSSTADASGSAILGLVAIQLLICLPLAWVLNLYVDEVYSLHTSSQGLLAALSGGIRFERQAPLYFGLLSLWRLIDPSVFFARLLSVLCISASLLVLARIARRLYPSVHPAWFVAPFALHPSAIWAAVEIRVYALAILLAALLLWTGLAAFFSPERQRRSLVAFIATAALSLYTYYYLGFLLVGLGAALLATGRARELGRYALALAAAGVLCAPIALWLGGQTGPGTAMERLGLLGAVRLWVAILADELVPGHRLIAAIASRDARWVARIGLFALLAAVAIRWQLPARLREREVLLFAVVTAVAALVFAAVAWLVGRILVEDPRYWSYLCLPGTIALVSAASASRPAHALSTAVAVLIAAHVAALVQIYRPLAKPSDAARVAALLTREAQPGEPILVFPNEWVLPLRYYYRGSNVLMPVPREPSLERYDWSDLGVHSEQELDAMMRQLPADPTALWLVEDEEIYRGREVLERYVDRHFTVEASWPFYRKLIVERLRRRSALR